MKIPCVMLIYEQVDILKRSLTFITEYSDILDIIVVENHSINTETLIKPYIMDLLSQRKIIGYYLFQDNITNNAFQIVLEKHIDDWSGKKYPYVMITDGDLSTTDKKWLTEEIMIMEKYPSVSAVACSLDMSNLPVKSHPLAIKWVPHGIEYDDFYEAKTGIHLLLTRTPDLSDYLSFIRRSGESFLDRSFHHFLVQSGKKWVRTKHARVYHITWDLYADITHPYTIMKLNTPGLWSHSRTCPYTFYENSHPKITIEKGMLSSDTLKEIIKKSDSLKNLREVNQKIPRGIIHEHTYVLYDLRTALGAGPKTYLEIGSWLGSSACLVARHPYPTTVICIDPLNIPQGNYGGTMNHHDTLHYNLSSLKQETSNFVIKRGYSDDPVIINSIPDGSIDLLFIDGNHTSEYVKNDFINYLPKVSKFGFIVFDDYQDYKYAYQVKGAVDFLVQTIMLKNPHQYNIIGSLPNLLKAYDSLNLSLSNEFIVQKMF